MEEQTQLRGIPWSCGGEGVMIRGSLPAVLEVRARVEGASLRLSDRKSSMEGLSRGRLSCCSPTSWRPETRVRAQRDHEDDSSLRDE